MEDSSALAVPIDAVERALLVADDAQGLCGTVQLLLDLPENQPHRADVAKMLVHRRARRQGLGGGADARAEAKARECGRTLLALDAFTGGDAEPLYERLGWQRVGVIPGYALMPWGGLCSTTVLYRNLASEAGRRRDLAGRRLSRATLNGGRAAAWRAAAICFAASSARSIMASSTRCTS